MPPERRVRRVRRLLIAPVALAALLATGGAYEGVRTAWLHGRQPASGELVEVGGDVMFLNCLGTGGPTVVIEAGAGSFSLDWQPVQRALSDEMRVCSYDRPGLGWSRPSTATVDPAVRLHELLLAAGEPGPYLLVGHSLGGLYVQRFARLFPREVAGVVLVDSVHPEQDLRLPKEVLQTQAKLYGNVRLAAALAHVGVPRLAAAAGLLPAQEMGALEPLERDLRVGLSLSSTHLASVAREAAGMAEALQRARATRRPFPDVPLLVISRGRPEPLPGLSDGAADRSERVWGELQQELVALAADAEHWIARESGHNVMLEQPSLIVDAVRHIARRGRSARVAIGAQP